VSLSQAGIASPASMADPTNGAEAEEELVDYEEEDAEAVTDVSFASLIGNRRTHQVS
jgi:hypothetical protein